MFCYGNPKKKKAYRRRAEETETRRRESSSARERGVLRRESRVRGVDGDCDLGVSFRFWGFLFRRSRGGVLFRRSRGKMKGNSCEKKRGK